MVVALRQLSVAGRKILPGETVPEFDSWSGPVRQAHLNLGWVEEIPDPVPVEEPIVEKPEEVPSVPKQAVKETGTLNCKNCGKGFRNSLALKAHRSMKHRGEE